MPSLAAAPREKRYSAPSATDGTRQSRLDTIESGNSAAERDRARRAGTVSFVINIETEAGKLATIRSLLTPEKLHLRLVNSTEGAQRARRPQTPGRQPWPTLTG